MTDALPYAGIRVLDLTTIVVGPTATQRLADFGAEVIKVEPPAGDELRRLGGPSPSGGLSGKYMHFNRGKRSVCLDLKDEKARDVLRRLVGTADVFVSNMRPAALQRLGLDPQTVRALNPAVIHCTITGFSPDGPYTGRPAYDTVVQGVSGIAGLALRRDGTPRYVPLLICDHTVGEITVGAIAAALFRRQRSGVGTVIEVPMFETMAAYVLQEHLGPTTFSPPLGPAGDARVLDSFNAPVQTLDGWISLSANTNPQAASFLRAIDRHDLLDDPRFATVQDRFRNATAWFELRANALRRRGTDHWLRVFAEHDVPAMVCHTLESLPDDPHLKQVGIVRRRPHATEGEVADIRPSILTDGNPLPLRDAAQPLGWDTRNVLEELGLPSEAVDMLLRDGAAHDGRAAVAVPRAD